mgnify:CR=1 FL=1
MIFLIAGRGSNKPFRDFEVFLEKLTEAIHNLTKPFQRLADAIKELIRKNNIFFYGKEVVYNG